MSYQIGKKIPADEVPNWERQPPKWSELVDAVFALEPGEAITVHFDDQKEAERARNAVRDQVNYLADDVICRTRLVKDKDGKGAKLYLARMHGTKDEKE